MYPQTDTHDEGGGKMKVLVIGSGGRDHAIAWKFQQSPRVDEVFVAPGNGGIASMCKTFEAKGIGQMADLAKYLGADLTFVGPEAPLSAGVVNLFEDRGLRIIGPTQEAAMLETSKAWAKFIMQDLGIPVAPFMITQDPQSAYHYVNNVGYPVVVKADGLAAGKGSLVCDTVTDATHAVRQIMEEKVFGEAGNKVVVEKRLYGRELSFFCFTDGITILPMEAAQDYKLSKPNGEGKNTGGMGAYSPHPWLTPELTELIMEQVARPLIKGAWEKYSLRYQGILYFGLMLVEEEGKIVPYVLEINVRLGDPEAQVILPRLQTDLVDICEAIYYEDLERINLEWSPTAYLCLMATSGRCKGRKGWYQGYPDRYKIGVPITGLERVNNSLVFHSGTEQADGQWLSTGGRVLSVVSLGVTLEEARQRAYAEMTKINFFGMYCRPDIGEQ